MREIKYIAIHCTATAPTAKVESIKKYWAENLGWKSPGYHFLIDNLGVIHSLLPIESVSNGVAGFNSVTINVSYIGGVEGTRPIDTRTLSQRTSMEHLVRELHTKFPSAIIQGHRDFPNVKKACPSFDVAKWLKEIKL